MFTALFPTSEVKLALLVDVPWLSCGCVCHHATHEGHVGTELCEAEVDGRLGCGFPYIVRKRLGRDWDSRTASHYFQIVPQEVLELMLTSSPYYRLPCGWQVSKLAYCSHTTDGQTCRSGSILGTAKLVFAEYLFKGVFLFHLGEWLGRYHFQLLVHFEIIK